jgi:hypothetical protein
VLDEEIVKTHIDPRYEPTPDVTTVSYIWDLQTITTKAGSDGFGCASYANSKVYAERYQQWIQSKHDKFKDTDEIVSAC